MDLGKVKLQNYNSRIQEFCSYVYRVQYHKLSNAEVIELQIRMEMADKLLKQYYLDLTFQDPNYSLSGFFEYIARAKEMLNQNDNIKKSTKKCCDTSTQTIKKSTNECCDTSSQTDNCKSFKSPIEIPKFDGTLGDWLEYRETYTRLIHSNDLINDINKFRYLLMSLRGSAAALVLSVEFSAENYAVAWELIYKTYNKENMLVNYHLSALLNIKPIKKESSVALKGLMEILRKNLQALELLSQPVKHWSTLLLCIVTEKLDGDTLCAWEKHRDADRDNMVKFDMLLQFLDDRVDVLEADEMNQAKLSVTNTEK